jgi:hypothetical protein
MPIILTITNFHYKFPPTYSTYNVSISAHSLETGIYTTTSFIRSLRVKYHDWVPPYMIIIQLFGIKNRRLLCDFDHIDYLRVNLQI